LNSVQESPFQDYDYDFENGDSSFDYPFENNDQLKMIGDLPGGSDTSKSASPEGDSPDKRGHPDDEDGEPGNKRRESEEKVAKKPGRKPLTSEPSSVSPTAKLGQSLEMSRSTNNVTQKRKAQNRAAQRAFRERKEKHLKDLEEKVGELQKASEQTSSENSALRAKVEKMTVELDEYKKRLAVLNNNRPSNAPSRTGFGNAVINNLNDVNFQFEFPKFGTLPGGATPGYHQVPKRLSSAPSFATSLSRTPSGQISPKAQTTQAGISPSNSSNYSQIALDAQTRDDIANYSTALFGSTVASKELPNGSRGSFDSQPSLGGGTNTSSPSASSSSNVGPSSSAGTSPEPFTQSPMGFKPLDTMTTIGEEQPSGTGADEGETCPCLPIDPPTLKLSSGSE
jgi:AP-1-like factor